MKKKLTEEEFIDWWLKKYHNTNMEEVKKLHPEWAKAPEKHTGDFYKKYAVTQEQHDEWHEWAINRISKYYRISKKLAKRWFALPSLNVAPSIK